MTSTTKKQRMDDAEIRKLLINTKGQWRSQEYLDATGISLTKLSALKQELGVQKTTALEGLEEVIEYAFSLMVDLPDNPEERKRRVNQAIQKCGRKFPWLEDNQRESVRRKLRIKFNPAAHYRCDTDSGYVTALRLPLNRIAEVFA